MNHITEIKKIPYSLLIRRAIEISIEFAILIILLLLSSRNYSVNSIILWYFLEGTIIFPIFHIAIPLILFEIPYIKGKFNFNRLAIIIGAILPDLIDKSMMFLGLGSGRGYSHTFLFVAIIYVIALFFTKRKTIIPNSLAIGILFHLLLDLPEIPLLFPFINYQFIYLEDPLGGWLFSLLFDPIVQITEILGLAFLTIILVHNKLYGFRKIFTFIRESNQSQLKE